MAQKLLLIVGPTAVGKTTLAVELAQNSMVRSSRGFDADLSRSRHWDS